jgi:hypothetical protein
MNDIANLMQAFMGNYGTLDDAFWKKYNKYYDYIIGIY